ncbi:MFS transporter [Ravibacter arvi]|uniref:MFS transporter n=2 Tax=Ravibacter arvi TaxID=2051041 RepID=A0ABP8LPB1_9BACT
MVPVVKERLALDDSGIGGLLLFLGAGAIVTMPATGWLISRIGSKMVILLATILLGITLPSLLATNTPALTAVVLFLFGSGIGAIDVGVNAQGLQIQDIGKKPVMSSLHGWFSIGGLAGPMVILLLDYFNIIPFYALVIVSVLLIFLVFGVSSHLLKAGIERETAGGREDGKKPGGGVAWLHPRVLFLGVMCFIVFLAEGAVLDWSGIFLRDVKVVEENLLGLGYAAFSVAMAFMRLVGDKVVSKIPGRVIVATGSFVTATGFLVAVMASWLPLILFGFVLVGLGAANIVPIFFSESGRVKGVPATAAIAAVTTIGYAGQLAGPAALGFIAEKAGLSVSFGCTAALMLLIGISYVISTGVKRSGEIS